MSGSGQQKDFSGKKKTKQKNLKTNHKTTKPTKIENEGGKNLECKHNYEWKKHCKYFSA